MPLIGWSQELVLGQPEMDATHREFVELLNRLGDAGEGNLLSRLDAFIAHTEAHFGQEEAWMEAMQFPALGCHRAEHDGVLEIMREVRKRIAGGEPHYGQVLAKAVAEWFPLHAQSMDTVLALYIQQTGFEASTVKAAQKDGAA